VHLSPSAAVIGTVFSPHHSPLFNTNALLQSEERISLWEAIAKATRELPYTLQDKTAEEIEEEKVSFATV